MNPGGDFATPAAGTGFDLTRLVQGWIGHSFANDGVLLAETVEDPSTLGPTFVSMQGALSQRPVLTITYVPLTGSQSFYTTTGGALTDRLSYNVNLASGNLMVQQQEINVPGVGLSLSIGHAYNNQTSKWLMTTGSGVYLKAYRDGTMALIGPSGYQIPFVPNPAGGFFSPPAIEADLTSSGGAYALAFHGSLETYNFNTSRTAGIDVLTSIVDNSGNKLSFAYNTSNQVTSVVDTHNQTTSFTYDQCGCLTTMKDAANRSYPLGNDSNGMVTDYTDPDGGHASYTYDSTASHNLIQIQDPESNLTKFTYTLSGGVYRVASVIRVTNPSAGTGPTTTFSYNAGNTVVTDPNGHATRTYFDAFGRRTRVVDALNHTTQLSWTPDNQVSQVVDPTGAVTAVAYNARNDPTQITLPDAAKSSGVHPPSARRFTSKSSSLRRRSFLSWRFWLIMMTGA